MLNRRDFLKWLSISIITQTGCDFNRSSNKGGQVLNLCNWSDYIHPKIIKNFEKQYNVSVNYDTFASNEALLAKLQASKNHYDIIVPTSYMLSQLIKLKILNPIDKERISNIKNLNPRFFESKIDYHLKYSVPFSWGTTGIAYNQDAIKTLPIASQIKKFGPDNFDIFFDPGFKGYLTLLDDPRETIGFALKRLGYSYNSIVEAELNKAATDLVQEKPLVMCYTSDQVIIQLASMDSYLSLAFSGDVYQASRQNKNIKYHIPVNGTSIWTDNWCIPHGAINIDLAYKWINYMLDPKIAAMNAVFNGYSTPNDAAIKLMPEDIISDKNYYPTDKMLENCEELVDIGEVIYKYNDLWTKIKCS